MGRKQPAYPPEDHATPDCNCTGKVCSDCGQTKCLGFFHKFILSRDGYRSKCKVCRKGEWTSEEVLARRRELYWENIEKSRTQRRVRYHNKPEIYRGHRRSSYKRNLETERIYQAQYNQSERGKQRSRQFRQQHPEITINRRNRQREAGEFTTQEWIELKTFYNYRCLCCGRQESDIKLTVDHVIPLVKGGANTIENIQPLCITCNKKKGTKTTDYRR
jgi:5-methylcytosine-specific restriction endonuclease McrA